jgi:hypothetical protein
MRVYLVAPVPLGASLVGWAVGWSLGLLVILLAGLALGFGWVFWFTWDAIKSWRRERALFGPAPGREGQPPSLRAPNSEVKQQRN